MGGLCHISVNLTIIKHMLKTWTHFVMLLRYKETFHFLLIISHPFSFQKRCGTKGKFFGVLPANVIHSWASHHNKKLLFLTASSQNCYFYVHGLCTNLPPLTLTHRSSLMVFSHPLIKCV